ncbi:hypothetical protein ONS95_009035 [Cadophora gregata]|uniref:uncharacterized protein n=1 Tax=Cadophora gregata TaxID=51156 RepID=UPI0026DAEFC1|nr:uncharacterized protein ONS95_009035 [Cadophora gregata]KAK0124049.1 hypothetical protein ONS95_009035 [Cadophora gregata]
MKAPAVDQLVYEFMFPKPKPNDPQNFQGLLQRNLVPEVRLETQAFYGHLSSQEAKYPGLDYSYQPHRVRLSRYPWHRRLFRAFDNVGLTRHEIASLTKWEGTRWAKERFEREQGIVIRDTTADGIFDWVPPELRVPVTPLAHRADIEDMEDIQEDEETEENEAENEMDEDIDDSDVEIQSVGVALNEQLRANAALRAAGSDTIMDEAWEQWLKEAAESGGIPYMPTELSPNANIPGTRPAVENSAMPSRLLNAARMGQWSQIPEALHNVVRQHISDNNRRMEDAHLGPTTPSHGSRSANPLFVSRPPAPTSATSSPFSRTSTASTTSSPFQSRSSLSSRARIIPVAMSQARDPRLSVILGASPSSVTYQYSRLGVPNHAQNP